MVCPAGWTAIERYSGNLLKMIGDCDFVFDATANPEFLNLVSALQPAQETGHVGRSLWRRHRRANSTVSPGN